MSSGFTKTNPKTHTHLKTTRSILTAGIALAMLGHTALALTLPVSEDSSTSGNAFVAKSAGRDTTLRVSAARQGLIRFEAGAFVCSPTSAQSESESSIWKS